MSKLLLGLILLLSLHVQGSTEKCRYMMAMFNVQNFITPDPHTTNSGMPKDEKDIKDKTKNLAKAIAKLNTGRGPDFLGFAEVGSQEHLNNLVADAALKKQGYRTVVVNEDVDGKAPTKSGYKRVIKVGFITRWKMIGKPISHVYWNKDDVLWAHSSTRPILETVLQTPNGKTLTVFVNHWPSKLQGQWAMLRRFQAGAYLKARVDELLKADPDANIVVMGDFNTDPWSAEMQAGTGISWDLSKTDGVPTANLYNLNHTVGSYFDEITKFKTDHPSATPEDWARFFAAQDKKYGTYYYGIADVWMNFAAEFEAFKKKFPNASKDEVAHFYDTLAHRYVAHYAEKPRSNWDTFDQIMISKNMMKFFIQGTYGPVHKKPFVDKEGHPNQFDNGTNEGLSDHLPVLAEFSF